MITALWAMAIPLWILTLGLGLGFGKDFQKLIEVLEEIRDKMPERR